MYEEGKANGVNIVNGKNMIFYLDEEETVEKINVIENPIGQYVPEVKMNEVNLRLAGFNVRDDKPERR